MYFKMIGFGLMTSFISVSALAEPPVQAGETLESLSKVKVSTTVNGQSGSIQELVTSGQIRLVDVQTPQRTDTVTPLNAEGIDASNPAQANAPADANTHVTDTTTQATTLSNSAEAGADSAQLVAIQDTESTLKQEQNAIQAQTSGSRPSMTSSADTPVNEAQTPPNTDRPLGATADISFTDEAQQAMPEAPNTIIDTNAE